MTVRFVLAILLVVAAASAPAQEVTLSTDQGDVVIRLLPEAAPEHVRNFVEHARSGLYAGTSFHRVVPGFVLQGGDPNTKDDDPSNDGMGGYSWRGPGTTLEPEFNEIPHRRGIVSMARSSAVDSAGSQFFIVLADAPHLDRQYTVFGEVVRGMDVVDRLVAASGPQRIREAIVSGELEPLEIGAEDWAEAGRIAALDEARREARIEALVAVLSRDAAAATEAARLLGALGRDARPALWRFLDATEPAPEARAEATRRVEALGDPEYAMREDASRWLEGVDPRLAVHVLKLVPPPDPEVRMRLATIRERLRTRQPAWLGRKDLALAAAALAAQPDDDLRAEAARRIAAGHALSLDLEAWSR